jgi:sulfite exporter TauE/SafE
MCGPLACALKVRPVEYHISRTVSYTLAGALCGALGQGVASALQGGTARVVPWALAIVLIVLGMGWEKRLPQPRSTAILFARTRLNRTLGWLTPLIPCGPLWLMLAASATTGSWSSGAIHMAAFAAGTIPLPFLLQAQASRLQHALSPRTARWTQQALALASAGLLVWRALLPLHASCH